MGMARTIGAVAGITALLVVLVASRPTAESPRIGATVRLAVKGTGEVGVEPASPAAVVGVEDLRAGAPPGEGVVEVRNYAARAVAFRLAMPASAARELLPAAGQVRVRVTRGERILADTTLIGLLRGTAGSTLAVGRTARIRLAVWIPAGTFPLFPGEEIEHSLAVQLLPVVGSGAAG